MRKSTDAAMAFAFLLIGHSMFGGPLLSVLLGFMLVGLTVVATTFGEYLTYKCPPCKSDEEVERDAI